MSEVPRGFTPYYDQDGITIYHGDCREILPTLKTQVEIVLTDPPYGVSSIGPNYEYRGDRSGTRTYDFFGSEDTPETMRRFAVDLVDLSIPLLTKSGSLYMWVGFEQFGPVVERLRERGFRSRFLVWVKKHPAPAPPGSGYARAADLCVYGYRSGRTWTASNDAPHNVMVADSYRHGVPGKVDHPTQRPLAVTWPLIENSSHRDDLILDPCMGSGTTLRAAKDLGRKAIGIEIEERYCEIAVQRLAQGVLAL